MSQEKVKEIWPTFLIVGATKSGTSSLYTYLKNTSGVYMSEKKEPNYFIDNMKSKNGYDKSGYLQLFENVKNEKAIGEASTTYLVDPSSAECIHDKIPNAKIIILLRDPVERAFSHYLMFTSYNKEDKPFHEIFLEDFKSTFHMKSKKDYLKRGLYSEQVKRYVEIFGKENVGIWFFEELKKDSRMVVEQVLKFLDVDSPVPDNVSKVYNPYTEFRGNTAKQIIMNTTIRKILSFVMPSLAIRRLLFHKLIRKKSTKPKLSETDRKKLMNYYHKDIVALEKILGKKTPWEWVKEYENTIT